MSCLSNVAHRYRQGRGRRVVTKRHTQLPWEQDGNQVFTSRGIVARCLVPQEGGTFNCQENAAFIVRVCNSSPAFEKMKEALQKLMDLAITDPKMDGTVKFQGFRGSHRERLELFEAASAALAAAEAAEKKGE